MTCIAVDEQADEPLLIIFVLSGIRNEQSYAGIAQTSRKLTSGLSSRGLRVVPFDPLDYPDRLTQEACLAGALHEIFDRLTNGRPRRVHIELLDTEGLKVAYFCRKWRLPYSVTHHNIDPFLSPEVRDARISEMAHYMRHATATICFDRRHGDSLRSLGIQTLLPASYGIDTSMFAPTRRREDIADHLLKDEDHDHIILYSGRLIAEKGCRRLAELRPIIQEHKCCLVVAGDGPLLGELQEAMPWAYFLGALDLECLAELYATADILLMPSRNETYSTVVGEAMASGMVVVTERCGASDSLISDTENGFVVNDDSGEDISGCLLRALRVTAAWPGIRAKARSAASGLHWQACFQRYYRSIIQA
ncbi:MAG TPA: glycosyltransferase [Planctomycetota bacterium]|nr:glycosyltransferase [Planctomycetota bacterium]